MDKDTFDYVTERVEILSSSGSSKQETKDAALAWKAVVENDGNNDAIEVATNDLLDFLEGRPTPIDAVIAFAQGKAKDLFGQEMAIKLQEKHVRRKAGGAKYCDCDSCAAASELLGKFNRIRL